ncbi:MAG: hypothetical protein H5U22_06375 [Rhizobium sp.]|nr:hypothetical protein [Rhizobium sp.]
MTDKNETLAAITAIRIALDAEVERHEAAMHEIAVALVTLENGLLPAYTPEEEALILEDHIMKMS